MKKFLNSFAATGINKRIAFLQNIIKNSEYDHTETVLIKKKLKFIFYCIIYLKVNLARSCLKELQFQSRFQNKQPTLYGKQEYFFF